MHRHLMWNVLAATTLVHMYSLLADMVALSLCCLRLVGSQEDLVTATNMYLLGELGH